MMGLDTAAYVALATAAASTAAAGVSAYSQYQSGREQAELGQIQARTNMENARLQRELTRTQRLATESQVVQAELEAEQQENERQRRAMGAESANRALAAFMGFDADTSGSFRSLTAENQRLAAADISAIRLLGGARQMQFQGQALGMAAQEVGLGSRIAMTGIEANAFSAMGRNAWIAPTGRFLGEAYSSYRASPWGATTRSTPAPARQE